MSTLAIELEKLIEEYKREKDCSTILEARRLSVTKKCQQDQRCQGVANSSLNPVWKKAKKRCFFVGHDKRMELSKWFYQVVGDTLYRGTTDPAEFNITGGSFRDNDGKWGSKGIKYVTNSRQKAGSYMRPNEGTSEDIESSNEEMVYLMSLDTRKLAECGIFKVGDTYKKEIPPTKRDIRDLMKRYGLPEDMTRNELRLMYSSDICDELVWIPFTHMETEAENKEMKDTEVEDFVRCIKEIEIYDNFHNHRAKYIWSAERKTLDMDKTAWNEIVNEECDDMKDLRILANEILKIMSVIHAQVNKGFTLPDIDALIKTLEDMHGVISAKKKAELILLETDTIVKQMTTKLEDSSDENELNSVLDFIQDAMDNDASLSEISYHLDDNDDLKEINPYIEVQTIAARAALCLGIEGHRPIITDNNHKFTVVSLEEASYVIKKELARSRAQQ